MDIVDPFQLIFWLYHCLRFKVVLPSPTHGDISKQQPIFIVVVQHFIRKHLRLQLAYDYQYHWIAWTPHSVEYHGIRDRTTSFIGGYNYISKYCIMLTYCCCHCKMLLFVVIISIYFLRTKSLSLLTLSLQKVAKISQSIQFNVFELFQLVLCRFCYTFSWG